jgi:hypothetical protein
MIQWFLIPMALWWWFITSLPMAVSANTVNLSKTCYNANENFLVSFTDHEPLVGDKVGIIHPSGTHILVSNLTCGANCSNSSTTLPTFGSVVVRNSVTAGQSYKAVLTRANDVTMGASSLFLVAAKNQTCPSSPAPTRISTSAPSPPSTLHPTAAANHTNTLTPTTAPSKNDVAFQALTQARAVIAAMVQATPRLTPQFLRMGFHDCIEMCDGM